MGGYVGEMDAKFVGRMDGYVGRMGG